MNKARHRHRYHHNHNIFSTDMRVHGRSISIFLSLASEFGHGIMKSTMAFSPLSIQHCWQRGLQMKPGLRLINSNHKKISTLSSSAPGVSVSVVGVVARDNLLVVSGGGEETNHTTNNISNTSSFSNTSVTDPVCRIVATSDGKISPSSAVVALSSSSRSLLEKIELLYSVESQKHLRNLTYMKPKSTLQPIESTHVAMDGLCNAGQEVRLVSILKQALEDGGYKLMNKRDLDLCSALNAGYLLRLSLVPDVKDLDPCVGRSFYPEMYEQVDDTGTKVDVKRDATPISNKLLFDGRVLVFRRGYSKEITNGRLLLPKLDYLQASLVQRSSSALTRKLGEFEQRTENFFLNFISVLNNAIQGAYYHILRQFGEFGFDVFRFMGLSMNSGDNALEYGENQTLTNDTSATAPSVGTRGNKVFKLSRYQASSTATLFNLNDVLSPFLLCDVINNTSYTAQYDTNGVTKNRKVLCQYDDENPSEKSELANSFSLLDRISIQNTVDFFTTKGRRELIKNFFKSSTLVEPAFEEVIVISKPRRKRKKTKLDLHLPIWLYEAAKVFDVEDRLPNPKNKTKDVAPDIPIPMEIKVFSDVPMANIEAVMPKAKLIFRPADAVVFDLVSVSSFIAVAGSFRFDSPKLDLIALISLIVFMAQTFFRYSNKYARYDLIVNKFITSKVFHRGPGAVKYVVSEANSNRALRAMLTRDWLVDRSKNLPIDAIDDAIVEHAKSHMNAMVSAGGSHIDIDVRSALDDLKDLQLINSTEVKDEQAAKDIIKRRWNALLCD